MQLHLHKKRQRTKVILSVSRQLLMHDCGPRFSCVGSSTFRLDSASRSPSSRCRLRRWRIVDTKSARCCGPALWCRNSPSVMTASSGLVPSGSVGFSFQSSAPTEIDLVPLLRVPVLVGPSVYIHIYAPPCAVEALLFSPCPFTSSSFPLFTFPFLSLALLIFFFCPYLPFLLE